jgi:hypothetical protein
MSNIKKKPKTSRAGKTSPPPGKTDTVKKTKQATGPAKKDTTVADLEKMRLTARDTNMNTALNSAFGVTEFDGGDPPAVRVELRFDSDRLTQLADRAKTEGDKLTKKNTTAQNDLFTSRLMDFTLRLGEAEKMAERIEKINQAMVTQKVNAKHSELAGPWKGFEDATATGDLDQAKGWLGELEARLTVMAEVLVLYNAKSGGKPVDEVPSSFYMMAGKDQPMSVLKRGLALVPGRIDTVGTLRAALASTKPPSALPELVPLAADAGVTVSEAQGKFGDPDPALQALNALRAIKAAGQTAAFFITGRGGQRWIDLAYIGSRGIKAWPGGTQAGVHLGPLDGPSISLAELKLRTRAPRPGVKKLDPDQLDPVEPRYLGDKPFINDGIKRGVVLPYATNLGAPIQYTEYDLRPYTSPGDRGVERLVVGNNRVFYTSDHYKTFVEVI